MTNENVGIWSAILWVCILPSADQNDVREDFRVFEWTLPITTNDNPLERMSFGSFRMLVNCVQTSRWPGRGVFLNHDDFEVEGGLSVPIGEGIRRKEVAELSREYTLPYIYANSMGVNQTQVDGHWGWLSSKSRPNVVNKSGKLLTMILSSSGYTISKQIKDRVS